MALVKDNAQALYVTGIATRDSESEALDNATTACAAKGGADWKERTTYCAIGFR